MDQQKQDELKSKLSRVCENYSQVNVPHEYRKGMDNISRNKNIFTKQVKGRGVVILDIKHYFEKCLNLLEPGQFKKLFKDPTKLLEKKMQRTLTENKKLS